MLSQEFGSSLVVFSHSYFINNQRMERAKHSKSRSLSLITIHIGKDYPQVKTQASVYLRVQQTKHCVFN